MRRITFNETVTLTSDRGRLVVESGSARVAKVQPRVELVQSYVMETVRLHAAVEEPMQDKLGLTTEEAAALRKLGSLSSPITYQPAAPETLAAYDAWVKAPVDRRKDAWAALLTQIDTDVAAAIKQADERFEPRRAALVQAVGEPAVERMTAEANTTFALARQRPTDPLTRWCDLAVWAGRLNIQSRLDLKGQVTARIQSMLPAPVEDKNLYQAFVEVANYRQPVMPDLPQEQLVRLRNTIRPMMLKTWEPVSEPTQRKIEQLCAQYINDISRRTEIGEQIMDALEAAVPEVESRWQERQKGIMAAAETVLSPSQMQYLRSKPTAEVFPPATRPATR